MGLLGNTEARDGLQGLRHLAINCHGVAVAQSEVMSRRARGQKVSGTTFVSLIANGWVNASAVPDTGNGRPTSDVAAAWLRLKSSARSHQLAREMNHAANFACRGRAFALPGPPRDTVARLPETSRVVLGRRRQASG